MSGVVRLGEQEGGILLIASDGELCITLSCVPLAVRLVYTVLMRPSLQLAIQIALTALSHLACLHTSVCARARA